MNKIAFLIPYFGKFNNYFPLFLNSCAANRQLCDWIILTDDHSDYDFPDNVRVYYLSWNEMKVQIQSKFDFPLQLKRPYKLCDLKPAYGYIFSEYISGYEFWGHCDTDLIWGDFSKFLTDDLLSQFDKIFNLGHCTIFKNNSNNNRMFTKELNGEQRYIEVFSKEENCSFDEEYENSINSIFKKYHRSLFEESFCANLYTKTSDFKLTKLLPTHNGYITEKKQKNFFVWNNGSLVRYVKNEKGWVLEEYLYIHFQSRPMKNHLCGSYAQQYKIIPNTFEQLELDACLINDQNIFQIKTKHFNLHYFRLRTKNFYLKSKIFLKRLFKCI